MTKSWKCTLLRVVVEDVELGGRRNNDCRQQHSHGCEV